MLVVEKLAAVKIQIILDSEVNPSEGPLTDRRVSSNCLCSSSYGKRNSAGENKERKGSGLTCFFFRSPNSFSFAATIARACASASMLTAFARSSISLAARERASSSATTAAVCRKIG